MRITIDLSRSQADRLSERAESLGVQPEELARAALVDLLANPDDAFCAAAEDVLYKNAALYRGSPEACVTRKEAPINWQSSPKTCTRPALPAS